MEFFPTYQRNKLIASRKKPKDNTEVTTAKPNAPADNQAKSSIEHIKNPINLDYMIILGYSLFPFVQRSQRLPSLASQSREKENPILEGYGNLRHDSIVKG